MRIHKDFKIRRREFEITKKNDRKAELNEDFHGICGYCGKNFLATNCEAQIDHFRPKSRFPEYADKYSNLVLSCKVCNNKKNKDWPSADPEKTITDDAKKGYIDPASEEYDLHLERLEDGSIRGKTDVGNYMVERFGFNFRLIKECFQIWLLYEETEKIRLKMEKSENSIDKSYTVELLFQLNDLLKLIHMKKET